MKTRPVFGCPRSRWVRPQSASPSPWHVPFSCAPSPPSRMGDAAPCMRSFATQLLPYLSLVSHPFDRMHACAQGQNPGSPGSAGGQGAHGEVGRSPPHGSHGQRGALKGRRGNVEGRGPSGAYPVASVWNATCVCGRVWGNLGEFGEVLQAEFLWGSPTVRHTAARTAAFC